MPEQAAPVQAENTPKSTDIVHLDKKLLQLPGVCDYLVIMSQRKDSRYFSIEECKDKVMKNRILVPMCQCEEFLSKLREVLEFGNGFTPKSLAGSKYSPDDSNQYVFTTKFKAPQGRRYYFDVIDADAVLSLKLSYVLSKRRDSIIVDLGSLVTFVGVIKSYQKTFPSLSGKDDIPESVEQRFDNRRGSPRGNSRGNRNFNSRENGHSTRGRQSYNSRPRSDEGAERRKPQGLKVCTDPAPCQFTTNSIKKYKFEIVQGTNTFMRMTEMIGESRKSTMHVPIDEMDQLLRILGEMNDRFVASSSQAAAAPVKT